ncbi:hypothetical protein Nepgr_011610 [Nepenthes gracilis]|uniref:Uncharacterized protein n=1 Tax=Nepenthes gracilis TaxID=150966 RepID=A0AAD3SFM1_NEPGR|nr:hypothetical protein Nepgr_011610 [Nepenthes gracilis]
MFADMLKLGIDATDAECLADVLPLWLPQLKTATRGTSTCVVDGSLAVGSAPSPHAAPDDQPNLAQSHPVPSLLMNVGGGE